MIEKLKQFLVNEFGITVEDTNAMTPDERMELYEKIAAIERYEAGFEPISERGILAAHWIDALNG